MKNVTYISASAGSGKTYRLTEELAAAIEHEKIKPESVILTTFTNKAADEFKEKAKAKLYQKGMNEAADRLDQALIGTVHSVATSFIQKYWYLLGLSPNTKVMTDEDVSFFREQSLSELTTEEELAFLKDFARQFDYSYSYNSGMYGTNYDFWKWDLTSILDNAKSFDIKDLSKSREHSKTQIKKFYRGSEDINLDINKLKQLAREMEEKNAGLKPSGAKDTRQAAIESYARSLNFARKIDLLLIVNTKNLLDSLSTGAFQTELKTSIHAKVSNIWQSSIVQNLQLKYVDLIFDLADRWREQFQKYKTEKHLIDYNDMEVYMLKLLEDKDVCNDIAQTYTCLFVDEFQDSSPIQVKMFDKLSDYVGKSIWVGDYKQAIYGFRGADIDLIKAVTDRIATGKNNCKLDPPLDTSWRSYPPIVQACNQAFTPVFSDILKPEQVQLKCCDDNEKEYKEKPNEALKVWALQGGNEDDRIKEFAFNIANMIKQGEKPENIAVLAKSNTELDKLAAELKEYNIPVLREEGTSVECNEVTLLTALLSLVVNQDDTMARAQVAFLTEPGYDAAQILDQKFQNNADGLEDSKYLADIPLIQKLIARRDQYRQLSIAGLVESIIIELDLYSLAKSWDNAQRSTQILHSLISSAQTYQDRCAQMSLPPTIYGFITYINSNGVVSAGDADGIRLYTYHGSKGLEWKNVILMSLQKDPVKQSDILFKNYYGVQKFHAVAPTAQNPYPEMTISVLPWVFGSKKTVAPDVLSYIKEDPLLQKFTDSTLAESKRVLYVGMTRPSKCLILTVAPNNGLLWFNQVGLTTQDGITDQERQDILGIGVPFLYETFPDIGSWQFKVEPQLVVDLKKQSKEYPVREQQPSSTVSSKTVTACTVYDSGLRINLNATTEQMDSVGTCIHNIFCVLDQNPVQTTVDQIIKNHDMVQFFPESSQILTAWQNLQDFLTQNYGPKNQVFHELPFKQHIDGQIFTGSIDYVWQTKDGVVLVDFKSYPGSKQDVVDPSHNHYAGIYAGQFECYERALTAAGKKVLARLVYYHVLGVGVEI